MLVGAPIYLVTVLPGKVLAGIAVAYGKKRSTDSVHTKADANIMLLCATWYANNVSVRGAHCK